MDANQAKMTADAAMKMAEAAQLKQFDEYSSKIVTAAAGGRYSITVPTLNTPTRSALEKLGYKIQGNRTGINDFGYTISWSN
jgi:hypothetical protein